ncbi:MAG: DUF5667 domain-containing protein [Candidatus Komeilibacteria bacterium]
MSHNIESQLHKLKGDTPDEAWVISNRERLMSQIETDDVSFGKRLGLTFNIGLDHLVYAPARVMVILLLVVTGFSTSVMAKASLPTSVLYPGRIVIEKVELMLASSPEQEAAVYNKHAQRRLVDLAKIKEAGSDEADLHDTLKRLEQDLAAAATSLDLAKAKDGTELDELALNISENATAAISALSDAKEQINTDTTKEILDEVLTSTTNVEDKALSTLIDLYENDDITADETVAKTMSIVQEQVLAISELVPTIDELASDTYVFEQVRQASKLLAQAEQLYSEGDFKTAFDILSQAKRIVVEVQSAIDSVNIENSIE